MTVLKDKVATLPGEIVDGTFMSVAALRDFYAAQIDAAKAADLLRAEKKLKALQKQARKAKKEIDDSKTEPKAFVLEHSEDPDIDAKIRQDLDDELRTVATNSFLAEVGRLADGDPLEVGALRAVLPLPTRADEVLELAGRIGELAPDQPHPVTALDGLGVAASSACPASSV